MIMVPNPSGLKKHFLLLVVIALSACNNKKPIIVQEIINLKEAPGYQEKWSYGQLSSTLKDAKVIAQFKSDMYCGRATCASVSIVEVAKADTIRVLELCNTHRDFQRGARVNIKPGHKPLSSVMLPVITAYDSKNYKTYYGTVSTAN